ncbi:MAG: hypothetical protein MH252_09995 [Thermosynechococcaceae cyanobacterium MS004]|nr:hypothetical protein [Thermosynechococcaceae cyanobacterium MS004]
MNAFIFLRKNIFNSEFSCKFSRQFSSELVFSTTAAQVIRQQIFFIASGAEASSWNSIRFDRQKDCQNAGALCSVEVIDAAKVIPSKIKFSGMQALGQPGCKAYATVKLRIVAYLLPI